MSGVGMPASSTQHHVRGFMRNSPKSARIRAARRNAVFANTSRLWAAGSLTIRSTAVSTGAKSFTTVTIARPWAMPRGNAAAGGMSAKTGSPAPTTR